MKNSKTVIVTGAAKGIGKETADLFARNGYNVLINYNNSKCQAYEFCHSLIKQGLSADVFKANVAIRSEVDKMADYCIQKFDSIDVLVNNAGISKITVFGDIYETEWDEVISVNLKGVFNCCQSVLRYMLKNKKGRIINVSSIWGITGASCEVHYSASKAGVIGLTKALAKELGPSNIQVNCIAPGIIETDMNSCMCNEVSKNLKENTPLMRFGTALEIAHSILFLSSEGADFITGQVISPNGGFII
ncbi:elongation factor P 5-aminopentanone reductase [Acetivibrio cellulolyticus]|uniref:elongation factor P 5-aminopentanone reductase n=1 Tax=Acetivibrio cellulolyticus TaxID=35830 RepID=UPI0001E2EBA8|nr:3-oxoacyl-ACP reductase FabG [Acetivibrio cellulolyticus]